jgi:site-specific DNA-methyltransferase (adenine-specific)
LENELFLGTAINGDCLDEMGYIPDKAIDMILCDLPYGTTGCSWDSIIDFRDLWAHYRRIIKPSGAIVLTSSQPFTSALVMSNPEWFRYEWIWEKEQGVNFQLVKHQPLKLHESILVFCKGPMAYNPQDTTAVNRIKSNKKKAGKLEHIDLLTDTYTQTVGNYPKSIIKYNRERGLHPTQKPVALFEYLIKTYTNPGELVLDNCAGSFTTAIACINTGRRYICIEKDEAYYNLGVNRIKDHSDFLL